MSASLLERLTKTLLLVTSKEHIGVKYSRLPSTLKNWGDALNAYLIPKISGKKIIHNSEYLNLGITPTLCGIGSILDKNKIRNLHVWGSGLKSPESPIPVLPAEVAAVRGRLTQKRLVSLKVSCPDIVGDPAIVLPKFYRPSNTRKKFKLGIIPHYVDKVAPELERYKMIDEVTILDIESPIEELVDRVNECEFIASSSLHGLILADAYDIPRVWLKLSDKILGGEFKFHDYFSTTDYTEVVPKDLHDANPEKLITFAVLPQRKPDPDQLLSVFPE